MDTIRGSERIGDKADDELYINFIATGQGDCIFIKTPLGRTILIDAGSKPAEKTSIASVGALIFQDERLSIDPELNVLDLLIITHPDVDHYNRLNPLVFQPIFSDKEDKQAKKIDLTEQLQDRNKKWPFPVIEKTLISTSPLSKKSNGKEAFGVFGAVLVANHGTEAQLNKFFPLKDYPNRSEWGTTGSLELIELNTPELAKDGPIVLIHETLPDGRKFKCSVLAAGIQKEPSEKKSSKKRGRNGARLSPSANDNANTLSIVTLLEYGPDRILLMGDANRPVEDFLLKHFPTQIKDLQVIQLPHHGSYNNAMTTRFTQLTNPKLVVCSAANNGHKHGLPRAESILQYAKHAEDRMVDQTSEDDSMDTDEEADKDSEHEVVYCFFNLVEEPVKKVKKRKDDQSEAIKKEVEESPWPEGFDPMEYKEGGLERGASDKSIRGRLKMTRNVQVTGSLLRYEEKSKEYVYGSNIELEFNGK